LSDALLLLFIGIIMCFYKINYTGNYMY